jgi:hypothetical protein
MDAQTRERQAPYYWSYLYQGGVNGGPHSHFDQVHSLQPWAAETLEDVTGRPLPDNGQTNAEETQILAFDMTGLFLIAARAAQMRAIQHEHEHEDYRSPMFLAVCEAACMLWLDQLPVRVAPNKSHLDCVLLAWSQLSAFPPFPVLEFKRSHQKAQDVALEDRKLAEEAKTLGATLKPDSDYGVLDAWSNVTIEQFMDVEFGTPQQLGVLMILVLRRALETHFETEPRVRCAVSLLASRLVLCAGVSSQLLPATFARQGFDPEKVEEGTMRAWAESAVFRFEWIDQGDITPVGVRIHVEPSNSVFPFELATHFECGEVHQLLAGWLAHLANNYAHVKAWCLSQAHADRHPRDHPIFKRRLRVRVYGPANLDTLGALLAMTHTLEFQYDRPIALAYFYWDVESHDFTPTATPHYLLIHRVATYLYTSGSRPNWNSDEFASTGLCDFVFALTLCGTRWTLPLYATGQTPLLHSLWEEWLAWRQQYKITQPTPDNACSFLYPHPSRYRNVNQEPTYGNLRVVWDTVFGFLAKEHLPSPILGDRDYAAYEAPRQIASSLQAFTLAVRTLFAWQETNPDTWGSNGFNRDKSFRETLFRFLNRTPNDSIFETPTDGALNGWRETWERVDFPTDQDHEFEAMTPSMSLNARPRKRVELILQSPAVIVTPYLAELFTEHTGRPCIPGSDHARSSFVNDFTLWFSKPVIEPVSWDDRVQRSWEPGVCMNRPPGENTPRFQELDCITREPESESALERGEFRVIENDPSVGNGERFHLIRGTRTSKWLVLPRITFEYLHVNEWSDECDRRRVSFFHQEEEADEEDTQLADVDEDDSFSVEATDVDDEEEEVPGTPPPAETPIRIMNGDTRRVTAPINDSSFLAETEIEVEDNNAESDEDDEDNLQAPPAVPRRREFEFFRSESPDLTVSPVANHVYQNGSQSPDLMAPSLANGRTIRSRPRSESPDLMSFGSRPVRPPPRARSRSRSPRRLADIPVPSRTNLRR